MRKDGILGYSSMGTIMKTEHRDSKELFVVKQMSKKNIDGTGWKEDINRLRTIRHPHICQVSDSWEDQMNVYMAMEFCKGGNLINLCSRDDVDINEGIIAVLVWQMVGAVKHLHDNNMVHSDIRPENWLFSDSVTSYESALDRSLKMIDFGIANKHGRHSRAQDNDRKPSGPIGKARSLNAQQPEIRVSYQSSGSSFRSENQDLRLFCRSPEQLNVEVNGKATSNKSDIWALGVITYFLLSGQSPFQWAAHREEIIKKAMYKFMPPEIWRHVSAEAKNFIDQCLQKNEELRPTAARALALPWMQLATAAMQEGRCSRTEELGDAGSERPSTRLSVSNPPLERSKDIMKAFRRMNQLNALEKACVITSAHCITESNIKLLEKSLQSSDKKREHAHFITAQELFKALSSHGVPTEDIMTLWRMLQDPDDQSTSCRIDYVEFINALREFQHNLQDNTIWAVFRCFDVEKVGTGKVTKQQIAELLSEGKGQLFTAVKETFPHTRFAELLDELKRHPQQLIEINDFKLMLHDFQQGLTDDGCEIMPFKDASRPSDAETTRTNTVNV